MASQAQTSTGHGPQETPSQISQAKAEGRTSETGRDGKSAQDAHENSNGNGVDHSRTKPSAQSPSSTLQSSTAILSGSGSAVDGGTSSGGLVPAPAGKASNTSGRGPEATETTTSTITTQEHRDKLGVNDKEDKPEDKSQTSTTISGAHAPQTRSSPRKTHKHSNSDGAVPSSSQANGKVKASSTRSSKPSFLFKLVSKLVPCIGPSTRAHAIEIDEPGQKPGPDAGVVVGENEKPLTKEPVVSTVSAEETMTDPSKEGSSEPRTSSEAPKQMSNTANTASPPVLIVPPTIPDPEVILPPTPTIRTLPFDETHGVTAGAVQPPGSTGEEVVAVKTDEPHTRRYSREPDAHGAVDVDGDESDGTSFEDEADQMDIEEDDEDRLIMNGGAGIPIGPDGIPRPLLPPITPQMAGRKCLVLDLDETLVHSSFKSIAQADYVVPVEIEYHWHNVYVIKRPGVDNFLKKMGEIYEVVVFTASLSKYADPVLDKLDIHQVVSHRLFRESCYNHKGNYVKDLSQLGRPIEDTIILDNSPASYIFHPNNAVPVSSWFNDPHDTELTDLVPFLADLSTADDVRGILDGGV